MKALAVSRSGALTARGGARRRACRCCWCRAASTPARSMARTPDSWHCGELLDGEVGKGALERQVLLFVPVFNVDGHERFGAWNRPNQRGPEEMGWRVTAQNYNLNRDYVKADAPEMQAMLRLVGEWDPIASIDLHVTDGAKFEHDVSIQVEPVHAGDAELRTAGRGLRDARDRAPRRTGSAAAAVLSVLRRERQPGNRVSSTACRRRASRPAISCCATASACWWRRIPGAITRSACSLTRNTVLAIARTDRTPRPRLACSIAHAADARAAALGGQPVALDVRRQRQEPHHRFPRLRVHAHALGGFRRADDALRRDARRRCGSCRCATTCSRR